MTEVCIRRELPGTNTQGQIQVITEVEIGTLRIDSNTRDKRKARNRFFPRASKENTVLIQDYLLEPRTVIE